MNKGSGTIQVRKRDGSIEPFDEGKLTRALWRVIAADHGRYHDAAQLASAVELYLRREEAPIVTSAAVFEMALQVLHRLHMIEAACALEAHRACRVLARKQLVVAHESDKTTYWDKSWLANLAARSWRLLPATARILADQIETALLSDGRRRVTRDEVIDLLNAAVASYGLADAVPVEQPVR